MLKDWRQTPATRRILARGPACRSHLEFVVDLCEWLCRRGLPLVRVDQYTPTLHPLMQGTSCIWRRDGDHAEVPLPHAGRGLEGEAWRTGPIGKVMAGRDDVIIDLRAADAAFGVPLLDALRAEGASEYFALAVPFADGRRNAIGFASDRPGGFSPGQRNELRNLAGPLGVVLDLLEWRRTAGTLLDTYLGPGPGREVLSGAIRRGDHRELDAVILLADLRGFTAWAARAGIEEVLDGLDQYFQILVEAVGAARGEVLKFLGDGLLAALPVHDPAELPQACRRALTAALGAREAITALNRSRAQEGRPPLDFVAALHCGRVIYGNVGATSRLDFTVIGPAVNLASRIEGLCKTLDRPILTSAPFARHLGNELTSIGDHAIRGLDRPMEIFAPSFAPTSAMASAPDTR